MVSSVDKIDVELLLEDFRVKNKDALLVYLKELWKDLSQRSEDKVKGINRITFSKYYDLPGIISERLFNVFDLDRNEYLDISEFVDGMTTLFTESFDKLIKFIFKFYDFDKDDLVTNEDIRVVLSYIPLNTHKKLVSKYDSADYKDRIESQEELTKMLDKCFEKIKKLDFSNFTNIVENQNSEICLYILIFLLEKKPFTSSTLIPYEGVTKGKSPESNISRMIASPSLNSKFSPSISIQKSPSMAKKNLSDISKLGGATNSVLNKLTGKSPISGSIDDSKSKLSMYSKGGAPQTINTSEIKNPIRKQRENLKNIEDLEGKKKLVPNKSPEKEDDLSNIKPVTKYHNQMNLDIKTDKQNYDSDDDIKDDIKYEGWLHKLTQTKKLKKLYFKLINKDLYYYKSEEETIHKGMHNLTGVFIEELEKTNIEGMELYCFNVVYPKKNRMYYVESKEEYIVWLEKVKRAIGFESLTDKYEVRQKLGKGKFGLVRLGIHKETQQKVAIKIMNKKEMNNQDLELVKIEIEIMKVCQQPNIIRLYDVFENLEYIYIGKILF